MKPTHVCRCCLSKDCYKDIATEYLHAGHKENYSDMLFDTFNLHITYKGDSKRLICEECIVKLRDATEFRKQVILAEEAITKKFNVNLKNGKDSITILEEPPDDFLDHITSLQDISDVQFSDDFGWQDDITNHGDGVCKCVESRPVPGSKDAKGDGLGCLRSKKGLQKKEEALAQVPVLSEVLNESDRDCDISMDEIVRALKSMKSGEILVIKLEPQDETNVPLEHRPCKAKTSTNTKKQSLTVDDDDGIEICGEVPVEAKTGAKRKSVTIKQVKPKKDDTTKRKKLRTPIPQSNRYRTPIPQSQVDMKQNTLKLIDNSNICLFESLKTKFRCFYCKNAYLNITELREHSNDHSNPTYLRKCINSMRGMSFKNVDISNLTCKLCPASLKDLNELKTHLTEGHKIEFPSEEHLLIPYRLENDFQCVFCDEKFNTFYRLMLHMNKHYANHVCEICGVSFINRMSLRTHVHSVHKEKKCSMCSATFQNNYTRVKHMRKMHNTKESIRYCLLCDKTFQYTYMLVEHKIQEHGVKRPISNCLECGKTFLTPQNLRVHIRSVHIRERNYACSFCGMRFFTKCDQRRHERTHEDIRSFACSYCEGRFKSKDSLRRHLKRQHRHLFLNENNDIIGVNKNID